MCGFKNMIISKMHRNRSSQCIFVFLTLLVILLMMLRKQWSFFPKEYYSSRKSEAKDAKDFRSLYMVGKTANPAIAWRPLVFYILPKFSNDVKIGMSTFWGRATSDMEIIALSIQHIGNDIYKVEFVPSFSGLYKVDVYLTYVNGEQFLEYTHHVKAKMVNVTGSPFFALVQNRSPPKGITRYCSQSESGTARGRWVKCEALRGIERCGGWQLDRKFDFDKRHGFFWLPYSCQLHYYTNIDMKKCLAKNRWERIVFTGDSHSRFRTYHWATRLYGTCPNCSKSHVKTVFDHVPKMEWVFDARGTRWPATFPKSVRRPNEIYIHTKTRRSLFSYAFSNSTLNGDLYFMNFGHWLLRVMNFKTFMSKKIAAVLHGVRLMNSTRGNEMGTAPEANLGMRDFNSTLGNRKKFVWVNNLSLKWREDEEVYKWTMTPSPSTIGYLNAILDQAMTEAGIQVVDAFQISNPRLSAVHDGTHYAKLFPDGVCAGVVENAVTNVILNALCNDQR